MKKPSTEISRVTHAYTKWQSDSQQNSYISIVIINQNNNWNQTVSKAFVYRIMFHTYASISKSARIAKRRKTNKEREKEREMQAERSREKVGHMKREGDKKGDRRKERGNNG